MTFGQVNKYKDYSAEQFVVDEFFQKWIMNSDVIINYVWRIWIEENPEKFKTINEAKNILLSFSQEAAEADWKITDSVLKELYQKIAEKEIRDKNIFLSNYLIRHLRIAAVLILAVFFSGLFFFYSSSGIQSFSTEYNETKKITLPDGSVVSLNSNSLLKYNVDWETSPREVWVEGEALFKVKKIKSKVYSKKFVVYSSNLSVEVFGTEFSVNCRRNRTRVVLKEGSVTILNRNSTDKISIKPGQLVEMSAKGELIIEKIKPQLYMSWESKELVFDQTPLHEIAGTLEDNFGYEVDFVDPTIKSRKFTGSCKTDEIDILLKKIAKSNNLNIQSDKYKIMFNNP